MVSCNDEIVFLINVKDEIEFSIIESKLNQVKIPIVKKYRESGGYLSIYMGNTLFGIDVYVPMEQFKIASEMIKSYDKEDNNYQNAHEKLDAQDMQERSHDQNTKVFQTCESCDEIETTYGKKKRIHGWITLLFFTPGVIILVCKIISYFVNLIKKK